MSMMMPMIMMTRTCREAPVQTAWESICSHIHPITCPGFRVLPLVLPPAAACSARELPWLWSQSCMQSPVEKVWERLLLLAGQTALINGPL